MLDSDVDVNSSEPHPDCLGNGVSTNGTRFPLVIHQDGLIGVDSTRSGENDELIRQLKEILFDFKVVNRLNPTIFKSCQSLEKISFSFNRISELDANIFEGLSKLKHLNLSGNQLFTLSSNLFVGLKSLESVSLSFNKISNLDLNLFRDCSNLKTIDLSGNRISRLDSGLFKNSKNLRRINFSDNQIEELDGDFFKDLTSLSHVDFSKNQITEIDKNVFRRLTKLKYVNFKCNYRNCERFANFNGQRMFDEFYSIDYNRNNKCHVVKVNVSRFKRFVRMFVLSQCLIEFEDTRNSESESAFNLNNGLDDLDAYFGLEEDTQQFLKLSSATNSSFSRETIMIFEIGFSTPLDFFLGITKIKDKVLLDLIERIEYVCRDRAILPEVRFIDVCSVELLCRRGNEFLMEKLRGYFDVQRSESTTVRTHQHQPHSSTLDFDHLFEIALKQNNEGIAICLVRFFFAKYLSNMIVLVTQKLHANEAVDNSYRNGVRDKFEPFVINNLAIFLNEYNFCLSTRLKSFYEKKWWRLFHTLLDLTTDRKYYFFEKLKDLEIDESILRNEFNKIVFNMFEYSFKNKQLEQLGTTQNNSGETSNINNTTTTTTPTSVIQMSGGELDNQQTTPLLGGSRVVAHTRRVEYVSPFGLDLVNPRKDWHLIENASHDHILAFIRNSGQFSLLDHATTKILLKQKWRKFPRQFFYTNLALYIVFLITYSFSLEFTSYKYESNVFWHILGQVFTWIWAQLAVYFFIYEVTQLIILFERKQTCLYFHSLQNILELINPPLCLSLQIIQSCRENHDCKTSIYAISILLTYSIMILRLEKVKKGKIGIYVTVARKIANRSLKVLPVVILLFLGFLLAFRFRLNDDFYALDSSSLLNEFTNSSTPPSMTTERSCVDEEKKTLFNQTISFSIIRLLTLVLGEQETSSMGLDVDVNGKNWANYIVYFAFLCAIPILIVNIFIGISVDEIRNLIDDSRLYNTKLRIEYVLNAHDVIMALFPTALSRRLVVGTSLSNDNQEEMPQVIKFSAEEMRSQKMLTYFNKILDHMKEMDETMRHLSSQQERLWSSNECLVAKLEELRSRQDEIVVKQGEIVEAKFGEVVKGHNELLDENKERKLAELANKTDLKSLGEKIEILMGRFDQQAVNQELIAAKIESLCQNSISQETKDV